MDALPARLLVTDGPDSGKSFGLVGDLMHIGTGPDNQIVLTDASLAEHQASIASRNGRFAIYVPPGQKVEIEGSAVPHDKWIWLPVAASLRMGAKTLCRFESTAQGGVNAPGAGVGTTAAIPKLKAAGGEGAPAVEESTPVGDDGKKRPLGKKKKAAARKAQVARFITDSPGETLVRLGEDGQLPELALSDARTPQKTEAPAEKNPLVLYGVLTCSFVLSLGLLLMDSSQSVTNNSTSKTRARAALQDYFGEDGANLEPYQKELRQALVEAGRGHYADERVHYKRVLNMLNASDIRDPANFNGLTGRESGRGRASDDELREHLQTLLAN